MSNLGFIRKRQIQPRDVIKSLSYRRWKRDLEVESFFRVCRETRVALGPTCNKLFASLWLNECQVICGTKSNELLVYDTVTKKVFDIPLIGRPVGYDLTPYPESGIHCIARSPSKQALAVGGLNVNDVAVYKLPELEKLTLGLGHDNWIFALEWLNDNIIVSGSRDHRLLIWDVNNVEPNGVMRPVSAFCVSDDLVRDIACCSQKQELAVLSPKGSLRILDMNGITKVHTVKAPDTTYNVCVTINSDQSMYAVGSSHCLMLADTNSGSWRKQVPLPSGIEAVRSLAFREHSLAVGCGTGDVLLYDTRQQRFFAHDNIPASVKPSPGIASVIDHPLHHLFEAVPPLQAVYTLAYSPSGRKLFAAGGPLNVFVRGHMASIFE